MPLRRGSIRLANFNPSKGSEAGKIRPCLVVQSDLLNEIHHPSTTVLPLTTRLLEDATPLRYRITSRDGLRSDSDIMIDQTRTLDNRRFTSDVLTTLTGEEMLEVEAYWRIVLGLE